MFAFVFNVYIYIYFRAKRKMTNFPRLKISFLVKLRKQYLIVPAKSLAMICFLKPYVYIIFLS
jgi:hypothetical protein